MHQNLLEHIYLSYQPQQYYTQYLKNTKIRPDSRSLHQHRALRISINDNSVTVSKGNTIIIVQINTKVEQVVYSPITKSYGKRLIAVHASAGNADGKRGGVKIQRNYCKAVESYVQDFIKWPQIQSQLAYIDQQKHNTFAHCGQISIRVASADGCVMETALIGVQILLWTCKFSLIQNILKNSDPSQKFQLILSTFWFPIKYCEILDETLIDPNLQQQQSSNYQLTLVSNICSSTSSPPQRIMQLHRTGTLVEETVQALEKLYKVQLSKLALNLHDIQLKCLNSSAQQQITIQFHS